ncbi:MAG: hypothetical protein Q4E73_01610 [Lachnospiraceae bacterium]|nr:hypothetical protein [Lachnospiraceae bacterium]
MIKYVVLIIIILIILAAVIFFLLNAREDSGKTSGKMKEHAGEDVSNDDIQALRNLLNDLEDDEEQTKGTRTFSKRENQDQEDLKEHVTEEAGTAPEELDVTREEKDDFGDETKEFVFDPVDREDTDSENGEPVLEYRITIDGKVSTGCIRTMKEEYLIGKSERSDVVLPTDDPVVGKKFLKIKPMTEKELFVLETVRPDWVLPIWSEESGKWEPRKGKIVFGMEEVIVIALTQFTHRSDKDISRLELAMPGYLETEESEEPEQHFSDQKFYDEEDDLFDI